jgi:hypothetical protein
VHHKTYGDSAVRHESQDEHGLNDLRTKGMIPATIEISIVHMNGNPAQNSSKLEVGIGQQWNESCIDERRHECDDLNGFVPLGLSFVANSVEQELNQTFDEHVDYKHQDCH